jgi:hypothetical protein
VEGLTVTVSGSLTLAMAITYESEVLAAGILPSTTVNSTSVARLVLILKLKYDQNYSQQ